MVECWFPKPEVRVQILSSMDNKLINKTKNEGYKNKKNS